MGRNVEIKAVARDAVRQRALAAELADGPPECIEQVDTFFPCVRGRYKLREFGDGTGEVIHYVRGAGSDPRVSSYTRVPTRVPSELRDTLAHSLGVRGRVVKTRELFHSGRTRIHFDHVEGLGDFIELEVVLAEDDSQEAAAAEAAELMRALGIEPADLVSESYIDLIEERRTPSDP